MNYRRIELYVSILYIPQLKVYCDLILFAFAPFIWGRGILFLFYLPLKKVGVIIVGLLSTTTEFGIIAFNANLIYIWIIMYPGPIHLNVMDSCTENNS